MTTNIQTQRQTGVGLLEILLTVVLISVAFLASARMQLSSIQNSQNAYYQSQAFLLVNDIIDRMRANIDGVVAGHYNTASTSPEVADPQCATKICTIREQAVQDLFDWSAYLYNLHEVDGFVALLPSSESTMASGQILALADGTYTVQMVWAEVVRGDSLAQSVSMNFALELPDNG